MRFVESDADPEGYIAVDTIAEITNVKKEDWGELSARVTFTAITKRGEKRRCWVAGFQWNELINGVANE